MSLPVVSDDDRGLMQQQFLEGRGEPHLLNLAWMLVPEHASKPLPSLSVVRRYFKSVLRRVHQLASVHKKYLAAVPDTQRLALAWYQADPSINTVLAQGKQTVYVNVEVEVDVTKPVTQQTLLRAVAAQHPAKQVQRQVREAAANGKRLEALIRGAPRLPRGQSHTIFRGAHLPPRVKRGPREPEQTAGVGDVLEWPRFTSFSLSPLVALGFQGISSCCIFRLRWDAGVAAVAVPLNEHFREFEVLLAPGKYRVTGVTTLTSPHAPAGFSQRVLDVEPA